MGQLKYATIFNPQQNVNSGTKHTSWTNLAHAIGNAENNYASSKITKTTHPWMSTAHSFGLNIPKDAVIKEVRFALRMKASKSGVAQIPYIGFQLQGKRNNNLSTISSLTKTGFYHGIYWNFGSKAKLTTTPTIYRYSMGASDLKKAGITAENLMSDAMGIDIAWKNGTGSCDVYLDWVRVYVDWELPNYTVWFDDGYSSRDSPEAVQVNKYLTTAVRCHNTTDVATKDQVFDIKLPFGCELINYSTHQGYKNSTFNPDKMQWTVQKGAYNNAVLYLGLIFHSTGLKELTVVNNRISDGGKATNYYLVEGVMPTDYGEVNVTPYGEVHKNHPSCFEYRARVFSEDENVEINIDACNSARVIDSELNMEYGETTTGVELKEDSTPSHLKFKVPANEVVDISWRSCFLINKTGNCTGTVTIDGNKTNYTYNSLDPYTYVINFENVANDIWRTHRIASEIDTDTYIFPCGVKEGDMTMVQSAPQVHMYKWEDLDYIGCVPLKQTHFDPKSTYKDTLLNNTYKNKTYMGKKGVLDEDITLNVRLPPQDVTTIQGLIGMDKPIPINANHRCFEGDSLNHRGWCEIYSIKTEQTGNNPHWYKCDIDVKYLTHNHHTRFEINKGKKSNTINVPMLLEDTFESGSKLDELFNVSTDGTYYYDEDDSLKQRNNFKLDNGQSLTMKTKETLGNVSSISLEWSASQLLEDKENQVTRIFSLIDARTNQPVFCYEYLDYDYSDDDFPVAYVNALQFVDDEWLDVVTNQEIVLDVQMDSELVEDDVEENPSNYEGENIISSCLHFNLNNRRLEVIDEGFNGLELHLENIELEGSSYYVQVEIKNNNTDADSNDILHTFDATVRNTVLTTSLDSEKYSKMYISPFPVADKQILFTRQSEEGTIYYYDDDGSRFTYIVEPFYQYHTGVDLKTRDGISIFNLNNSYPIVYVQNGLVRLGLNRLTGDAYVGKYDVASKTYITTHILHINNQVNFSLGAFSDDKIEINASKSKFTIWRGHPYIMINHKTEDIDIRTKTQSVWAEGVGDNLLDYPVTFDLLNHYNLLDKCVGGVSTLNSDCVTVSNEETSLRPVDLVLKVDETVTVETPVPFNVTGLDKGLIYYLVNGELVYSLDLPNTYSHTFKDIDVFTVQAVFLGDEKYDASFSNIVTVKTTANSSTIDGSNVSSNYKLTFTNPPSSVKYLDNYAWKFRLTKGNTPVANRTVEFVAPIKKDETTGSQYGGVITAVTNSQGYATYWNADPNFIVGKYDIGARYYVSNGTDKQLMFQTWKKGMKITKNNASISISGAGKKGGKMVAKITKPLGHSLAGKKAILYVNGKKNVKTINKNGYITHNITSKGHYTYKVVYGGDANLNYSSKTFEERIV